MAANVNTIFILPKYFNKFFYKNNYFIFAGEKKAQPRQYTSAMLHDVTLSFFSLICSYLLNLYKNVIQQQSLRRVNLQPSREIR